MVDRFTDDPPPGMLPDGTLNQVEPPEMSDEEIDEFVDGLEDDEEEA